MPALNYKLSVFFHSFHSKNFLEKIQEDKIEMGDNRNS